MELSDELLLVFIVLLVAVEAMFVISPTSAGAYPIVLDQLPGSHAGRPRGLAVSWSG